MLRIICTFVLCSFIFCENIYYLPEDTFFVASTTTKKMLNLHESSHQMPFTYNRLYSSDSSSGNVGNIQFLYYPTKNIMKFLNEISTKYDRHEYLYIFFYDPSFDIKKHIFAKNYNPNHLFQRRRYHSEELNHYEQLLKDKECTLKQAKKIKEMLTKANKKFLLPHDAPQPLGTEKITDDMLQEQVEQTLNLLEEKDWFVEEGWGGDQLRRLSKEEMTKQLEYRILNERVIKLHHGSPHNIWVISQKDFTMYKEGKGAVFYRWDGQILQEINQQQPKPNLNVKIKKNELVAGEKSFLLDIYVENLSYVHVKKVKVTYRIPNEFEFIKCNRKGRYTPPVGGRLGFVDWEVECYPQGGPIITIELHCNDAGLKVKNKLRLHYMGIHKIFQYNIFVGSK